MKIFMVLLVLALAAFLGAAWGLALAVAQPVALAAAIVTITLAAVLATAWHPLYGLRQFLSILVTGFTLIARFARSATKMSPTSWTPSTAQYGIMADHGLHGKRRGTGILPRPVLYLQRVWANTAKSLHVFTGHRTQHRISGSAFDTG